MEGLLLVDRLSWVVLIQRVPISQCECRDQEQPTGLACRSIEMKRDCSHVSLWGLSELFIFCCYIKSFSFLIWDSISPAFSFGFIVCLIWIIDILMQIIFLEEANKGCFSVQNWSPQCQGIVVTRVMLVLRVFLKALLVAHSWRSLCSDFLNDPQIISISIQQQASDLRSTLMWRFVVRSLLIWHYSDDCP